jgi:hypothetical protein
MMTLTPPIWTMNLHNLKNIYNDIRNSITYNVRIYYITTKKEEKKEEWKMQFLSEVVTVDHVSPVPLLC